jgi:hypothetical protein
MRKEKLMQIKKEKSENFTWYAKHIMEEEDLASFSVAQLEKLEKILERAESFREKCTSFSTLSENEIVHKRTGKIVEVTEDGVREVLEDEILSGAASEIYKKVKKENELM